MNSIEKFIFVITYGRSGSTILMKVLNTIERAEIKGENSNTLFPLYRSWKSAKNAKKHQNEKSHLLDHPWYGVNEINPDRYAKKLANVFIDEILHPKEETRIVGFKEIRYVALEERDIEDFIEFLKVVFGEIYLVFNRRNFEDVAKSGWWKLKPYKDVVNQIKPLDDWMVKYHKKHPEYTFITEYDEYKNNYRYFEELFEFIGEDFDDVKVEKVLSERLNHLK